MSLLYLKPIHVSLAVIWVAGLLALLLFARMPTVGRVLWRWNMYATLPAMLGTLASGLWLTTLGGWLVSGQFWLLVKLVLVVCLVATHGFQSGVLLRTLSQGQAAAVPTLSGGALWAMATSTIIFFAAAKPF